MAGAHRRRVLAALRNVVERDQLEQRTVIAELQLSEVAADVRQT